MAARGPAPRPIAAPRGRCRCGHLPTDHMVVVPVTGSAVFRLDPTGPCRRCGASACPRFTGAASP